MGLSPHAHRDRLLGGRARHLLAPERPGDRGRLHVGGRLPGRLGAHLPVRVRRLPDGRGGARVLHPRPAAARGAHAQRRQVHDGRRPLVPPQPAARAHRGGDGHAVRRSLLPAGADDRGGRAHRGARRAQLPGGGAHHGRGDAHLRHLRRDARHHLGADHQGRAAARGRLRARGVDDGQVRLQPLPPAQHRGRPPREGDMPSSAPGLFFTKPLDAISTGIAFALGTAGLPHILMRFFTVPRRQGGARVGGLGGPLHRRASTSSSRSSGSARARILGHRRREARRQERQPGRALSRRERWAEARAAPAATSSSRSSPPSPSPPSWRWWRGS